MVDSGKRVVDRDRFSSAHSHQEPRDASYVGSGHVVVWFVHVTSVSVCHERETFVLLHTFPGAQKTQEEQARLHRALKAEVEAQVSVVLAWLSA